MSANSVSALAYRAREGLRQAFLTMHLQELEDDACAWTHQNLGAYVRNGISRRDATKVEQHLSECRRCTALYLELTEVNSNLSGLLAPLLLGGAAAAYVGSAAGAAGGLAALKGALVLPIDRAKDFLAAHAPASAAAGVATAVVVGGSVLVMAGDDSPEPQTSPPSAVERDRGGSGKQPAQRRRDRSARTEHRPGGPREGADAVSVRLPAPPTGDTAAAEPESGSAPASGPEPSGDPGRQPSGQSSGQPPSGGPTAQEPPPPTADLRVSARASSQEGALHRVVVVVSGLSPSGTATLTVAAHGATVVLTRDGRCDSPHPRTCRVTSSPATLTFTAVTAPDPGASLVFTVSSDGASTDPDRSNNRATVRFGS
jgi:hypothetical protein